MSKLLRRIVLRNAALAIGFNFLIKNITDYTSFEVTVVSSLFLLILYVFDVVVLLIEDGGYE